MKRQNTIIGIIGPKDSGKTFYARQLYLASPRAIVFDPADDEYEGKKIYGNPRQARDAVMRRGNFHVHYIPLVIEHQQGQGIEAPGLDYLCSLVWAAKDCTLMIDEAHEVCSSHSIPNRLLTLVRMARHRCVSVTWMAHGFADVSPKLRKNTDYFIFHRIHEYIDLEEIKRRCGNEVRDAVASLRSNDQVQGVKPQRLEYNNRKGTHRIF